MIPSMYQLNNYTQNFNLWVEIKITNKIKVYLITFFVLFRWLDCVLRKIIVKHVYQYKSYYRINFMLCNKYYQKKNTVPIVDILYIDILK